MDNNAITAGVRIGGLTDKTEIKILLCYLLNSLKEPITHTQLMECIVGQELVNYFELNDALGHLIGQNLISESADGYTILPEGAEIALQLEKSLPFSVKERAYKTALKLLQYQTLKKQNLVSVTPKENGGYNLKCTIASDELNIFSFEIFMPDEKTANFAKEQFILKGQDIFKCVIGLTTDDPAMFKEILEREYYGK